MIQARPAAATVAFVDDYCQLYEDAFPDVRSFEHFKPLHGVLWCSLPDTF